MLKSLAFLQRCYYFMFCIIFCICGMLLSLSFANPMTPYSKAYQVNLNNWLLLSHVYGYINRDDTLIPFLIIADLPRPLKATQIPPLKRNGYTISDNTDHPRLYGRGVSAPTILVLFFLQNHLLHIQDYLASTTQTCIHTP